MKTRVRLERIIVVTGMLVVLFLTLVTSSYYQSVLNQVGKDGGEDRDEYRYHYVMIVEDYDMPFWKDVYESTGEAAREHNALVELMRKSLSSTMEIENLMDMAIASRVDGVILEYIDGRKIDERINEAGKAGIPVVAILKDAPDTSRISSVGVDDYQLGRQYGEQILKLVPSDKDGMEMMFLLHDRGSSSQVQITEQINNLLVTSPDTSGRVRLVQETIRSTGKVSADETIRNIFFRKEGIPDVLVCTETMDTGAAYQAMIDYSKVGELQLLGYYKSDQVLETVGERNTPVTLVTDMGQMGRYCVQALEEYLQEEHVSSYYSVDLQFVTEENVDQNLFEKWAISMERPGRNIWSHLSLGRKTLLAVTLMILTLSISNTFIYLRVNKIAGKMDTAYTNNVSLSELSEALEHAQEDTGDYVSIKSSGSLKSYYKNQQEYQGSSERLDGKTIDKPGKILKRSIRMMSESYLGVAQDAIQARRGRNVERYREAYERALTPYRYINTRISELNGLQLEDNSASHQTMGEALRYMGMFNMVILMIVMLTGLMVLRMLVRGMVTPLTSLAGTANLMGQGDLNVKMPDTDSNDETDIVTRTFNQMVGNPEEYVAEIKKGAEKEQGLLERELLMESRLKEARLRYLQFQINPYFLFNSLNAGAQLVIMEDAEKTCVFLDKMAEFFRYNVKRGLKDVAVGDEAATAENYIYILDMRLAGDIQFKKSVGQRVLDVKMPSMILQPVVEDVVRHGIRGMEESGTILLTVHGCRGSIRINVRDNGKGMSRERILEVMEGREQETPNDGDSTGIGLDNVTGHLELYYQREELVQIVSEGPGMGTGVIIHTSVKEGIGYVSNITSR